jgi:hypothetical protein
VRLARDMCWEDLGRSWRGPATWAHATGPQQQSAQGGASGIWPARFCSHATLLHFLGGLFYNLDIFPFILPTCSLICGFGACRY